MIQCLSFMSNFKKSFNNNKIKVAALALLYIFSVDSHAQQEIKSFEPSYWFKANDHHFYAKGEQINFNESVLLDIDSPNFEFEIEDIKHLNMFMVYNNHLSERIAILKTTDGFYEIEDFQDSANRSKDKYFEPKFVNVQKARIRKIKSGDEKFIVNSSTDKTQKSYFIGDIAEIILFETFINEDRRKQIESYLSMKYGISLSPKSTYFDSQQNQIFEANKPYRTRVTAIGRDDYFNWHSIKAKNEDSNSIITIEKMTNFQENHSYVFMGDQGGEINFNQNGSKSDLFGRSWELNSINFREEAQEYKIQIDEEAIEIEEGFQYFIVHKTSSIFEEDLRNANWYKLDEQFKTKIKLDFKNVMDNYLFLVRGSDFHFSIDELSLNCNDSEGILAYEFDGYSLDKTISLNQNNLSYKNYGLQELDGELKIPFGANNIRISDRGDNTVFSKSIFLDMKSCSFSQKEPISVSPNPSLVGQYIDIINNDNVDLRFEIYNHSGHLISSDNLSTGSKTSLKLTTAGSYTIIIPNGETGFTKKFIIQ